MKINFIISVKEKKMFEKDTKNLKEEIFLLEYNFQNWCYKTWLPGKMTKQNLKGQCIGSKIDSIEDGEKPSNYFTS